MALTLVAPPVSDPVSLQDLKAHLRIDGALEDATLYAYLEAARRHLEGADGWLNRCFISQEWDWTLDRFPWSCEELRLPLPPLQSVTSVTYIDAGGTLQTWDPTRYTVDAKSEPGRLAPAYAQIWPSTRTVMNAVTVRFVAGYGMGPAAIPRPIRLALLGLAGDFYEHRDTDGPVPGWIQALLASYRFWAV